MVIPEHKETDRKKPAKKKKARKKPAKKKTGKKKTAKKKTTVRSTSGPTIPGRVEGPLGEGPRGEGPLGEGDPGEAPGDPTAPDPWGGALSDELRARLDRLVDIGLPRDRVERLFATLNDPDLPEGSRRPPTPRLVNTAVLWRDPERRLGQMDANKAMNLIEEEWKTYPVVSPKLEPVLPDTVRIRWKTIRVPMIDAPMSDYGQRHISIQNLSMEARTAAYRVKGGMVALGWAFSRGRAVQTTPEAFKKIVEMLEETPFDSEGPPDDE